jgi:uncharacterized protein (DUF58 family)
MRAKLGLLAAVSLVVVIALLSGSTLVYFLAYLVAATAVGAHLLARRGLDGLEAGSWLDRRHATVGDILAVTYTLRSHARLPRPWLEVHSPSTLPLAIPGRVISLAPRTQRTWAARVPLPRRGQYRVDPLVVRTGDPLGLFESVASVGPGATILVYPQVAPLPTWDLPPAAIEAASARGRQGSHVTPAVTSVRPYTSGDAFNRIHWRSSARHQELQVKEFDIEPSADLWIFLDLHRGVHVGVGDTATVESAVRVAAALAGHALADGRGVGMEAVGVRRAVVAADRGVRQRHKILGLLAVAEAEGSTPLVEMLLESTGRARRGMVVMVVTPSLDGAWVRPLSAMRGRGVAPVACLIDPLAHLAHPTRGSSGGDQEALPAAAREPLERAMRAQLHSLAEHDVRAHIVEPGRPLGEQLFAGRGIGGWRAA